MTDRGAEPADSVLLGEVVTLDAANPRAEAVAIRGERILAVGARADVLSRADARTEVHDFGKATIIPGFNDTHAHMDTEGLKTARPSLAGARTIDEVLSRIAALARERPAGSWIVTMPVGAPPYYFGGPAALAEGRMPTRGELDRAAPDHPVCILPPSGYWGAPPCYTALNTPALGLNGIGRDSAPRLPGIEIVKDADGEPTGVFVDHNAHESVQLDLLPAVPVYTREERLDGIRAAQRLYHGKGTTSIYEGHGCSPEVVAIYRDLWEQGALTMRVGMVVNPVWESPDEAEGVMRDWLGYARGRGLGDAILRISGIQIGYGGDRAGAGLAHARSDYTGYWSHIRQANDPDAFAALCTLAARYDLRVHTIASAGTQRAILPILQQIDRAHRLDGRRWVLEHLSLSRREDLEAMKALGVGVTLIPTHHLWKGGAPFLDLDEAEAELVVPAKQLQEIGVPLAAGTDNTPYDPLVVMASLMLREERTTGRAIGPGARLSAEAALRTVTCAGAWLTFEEDVKGRLRPGFYADCAVLSENPLDTDPRAFGRITCLATMVGGAFVHRA